MFGSVRSCCVPKCAGSRSDTTLHVFPHPTKEKERFLIWKNAVGDSIANLDDQYIYTNRKICHDHFDVKYTTWTKRLSPGAVPTLLMPGFQSGRVLRDISNIDVGGTQHLMNPAAASTSTAIKTASADINLVMEPGPSNLASAADIKLITEPGPSNLDYAAPKKKGLRFIDDKTALIETIKKLTKKKESYATRLKKAMKLSTNKTFLNVMNKFTSFAAIFMAMQFREYPKKKTGRRYTEEEKVMALSLYKLGPRLYRLFSKKFALPSPMTLSRLIARANLRAGINEKIFKVLLKRTKNFTADDKLCVLMFDEIAIFPHFDYNPRKDSISGFVTNGITKKRVIADHALVFMIRGITRNYKQPIAYTFCSGSTRKEELTTLIKAIIRKLHRVGMRVLATICDQGSSNVSSINKLIAETKAEYYRRNEEFRHNIFEVDGKEIIPLYDPPHLIKGIRNNLLQKDLQCSINGEVKIAKWNHIAQLHKEDPSYAGVRLLNKLTDDHINPEKCKMRVKYATQVFSQRVASTMGYLADKNILPAECKQTADVLLFFDELFDSMNGSQEGAKKKPGKPLLGSLKPNSRHNSVWANAKRVLNTMQFKKNDQVHSVPSLRNWLFTINNMEHLRDILFEKYNVKSIWTRHFNQDPLENFFGSIRSHGFRNVNPSPDHFETAFASLLINNLTGTHSPGSNCEDDSSTMLLSMSKIFKATQKNNTPQEIDINYMQENVIIDFDVKINDIRKRAHMEYISGYMVRRLKRNIYKDCACCKENFTSREKNNEYINAREFNKNHKSLEYPTTDIMKVFSLMQDIMMWVLKKHSDVDNIGNYAKTIMCIELQTNFMTCEVHKKNNIEYMMNWACNFFINNWCKEINNILKGRSKNRVLDDNMKALAQEFVRQRRKLK